MAASNSIRAILTTGCRWSKDCVWKVVELVDGQPRKMPQLIECLWDDDALVSSGAADALERLTREKPALADRWKEPLLGLLAEAGEKRLRWNLALTIPRMKLTVGECRRAAAAIETYLDDRSSVVKTAALHALTDLALRDTRLLPEVMDLLHIAERSGTPAMRARSRILLKALEKPGGKGQKRSSVHMFD